MSGKITVFRGSPRKNGNTNALCDVVVGDFVKKGIQVTEFDLYRMNIRPCIACRECQKDWSRVTCAQQDDFQLLSDAIMASDVIVLATPIYSWYCTPPVKALLDRMVYAHNMYYGEERGPSLWEGRSLALITTCGYPPEKGADLLE